MRKFQQYYVEESDDYVKKTPDYGECLRLIKVFPWLFPTYKIHISVLPRISVLFDMFDILLPFVDRYVFVQRNFQYFSLLSLSEA